MREIITVNGIAEWIFWPFLGRVIEIAAVEGFRRPHKSAPNAAPTQIPIFK